MATGLAVRARELGCQTVEGASMSAYTTFKIGGPVPLLVTAPGKALPDLYRACQNEGWPVLLLGNGSNLLVSDDGLDMVVIRLDTGEPVVLREETEIVCPAGLPLKQLCRFARDRGLSGLEFAFGIPGTVGGGVYMNAGAYGGELRDVVTAVTVLTPAGEVKELSAEDMAFSYRHSALMEQGGAVLSATFSLMPDDPAAITARMEEFLRRRREKQPLEYPSAGSFFKRPPGHYAGTLIEQCGLKGFRVGDAQVSEKHAGFVINRGQATCKDMRALAREVRRRVYEQAGVTLEPEVRLLGAQWDDPV